VHRNRTLAELAPQATAVLQAVLRRAMPAAATEAAPLLRPGKPSVEIDLAERPPLALLPEYGRTRSSGLPA
jgi:hypothetical protein